MDTLTRDTYWRIIKYPVYNYTAELTHVDDTN